VALARRTSRPVCRSRGPNLKPRLLIANPDAPEADIAKPAPLPAGHAKSLPGIHSAPAAVAPVGAPLPKRPKGSLFIGSVLLLVVGAVAYLAWNATLRYSAFGSVTGKSIAVNPPWPATIEAVLVRDGDLVRQGDELVRLASPQIQDDLERLSDELRLSQSELDAHVAELTLAAQQSRDRQQLALAEYYKLVGELLSEQSKLSDLEGRMARSERLSAKGAVAGQDHDSTRLAVEGQRAKVERLELAVSELKKRTDADNQDDHGNERLKPKLVRIEQIQASIERLRERLRQGIVRAPANGRVLAICKQVGEYAEPAAPLVELLAEDSLEITLLVTQNDSSAYRVGQRLEVEMQPLARLLTCEVTRIGDAFCEPPPQIETRFRHGEPLLPVILKPLTDSPATSPLKLGGEVRQPRVWSWTGLRGA
jgi:multidrug resistance efflux pump